MSNDPTSSSALPSVTFVTGNMGKLREVQAICSGSLIVDHVKLDLDEIQSLDARDVTLAKAKEAYSLLKKPVLIEDTSITFNALNGLPGTLSKWFLVSLGAEGMIRLLAGFEDRSAYASCIFCLYNGPSEAPLMFEGRCDGSIVHTSRGAGGFGWDGIFEVTENSKTYAEMTDAEKNSISHRARALHRLREHFQQPAN